MDIKIEQRLLNIVNDYFACKNNFRILTFSSGSPDYDSPFYRYYRDVEITFLKLNKDEQMVLRYEYFYRHFDGWWKSMFDYESFFKLRESAVYKFVRYFDENH